MSLIGKTIDGQAPVGGHLIQGKDGSGNAQDLLSDTDGHLQVDVLSGGGGGTQYDDGDSTAANPTGTLPVFDNAGTITAVSDSNPLPVSASLSFAATSALGTNSSNEASNSSYANWSTNTWTGAGEQNDYSYVAVSLQTDDAGGTLYFDFSVDGTNWTSFPVAGFTIVTDTHEFHSAVKGSRYFRPRFVGTGSRTYFRLYTYYSNAPMILNSSLNTSMTADVDGTVVKSAHKVEYQTSPSGVADGDFDVPSITRHKQIRTRDQVALDIQDCNDSTDFTVFNNDTDNLANSVNHQFGTGAITFDKVDGAGNTVYAGVYWTIASLDIQELFEDGGFVGLGAYLTSLTNVVRVILRLGTDASNYNEWRWEVDDLTANRWNRLRAATGEPDTYAGNGWDTSDIDYGAVLVEFNSQSNTLSGIVIDNIHMVSGRITDVQQNVSITSNVTGSKVDVTKISGTAAATNTGNADAGTQRVVLATDQPAVTVDLGANNDVTLSTLPDTASGDLAAINSAVSGTLTVDLGANNDVTVTGTVDLGSTDNAVLDTIASPVATISSTPLQRVAIFDASDAQITSFGGGTQYTEGDTDATITGTALMFESDVGTNTVSVVSDDDPLPVYIASAGAVSFATEVSDDAGFGTGTGGVTVGGFVFDDTLPDSVDEGDVGYGRMSANRNQYMTIRDAAGNERGVNVNASNQMSVSVDNTVTVDATSSGDVPITLGGEAVVLGAGAASIGTLGANSGTDIGDVTINNGTGASAVNIQDGGNTITVDGSLTSVTTVSTVSALGAGTTGPMKAEDAASANGDQGIAIMATRLDTPVANAGVTASGDYTTPILDNFRKLWVSGTVPEDTAHVAGEAIQMGGERRIGTLATSSGSDGDWSTANQTTEGASWVTTAPTTTSGCSIFRTLDLDETEEDVKTSAGNVYGYYFYNAAATVTYLKFYNATAANVTVGTTTPVLTFPLPATQAGHISFSYPISFSTAICVAATTGVADNDTGAPAANDLILNVFFK